MAERPVGAVIEIIERRSVPSNPDHVADDIVVPSEIRINGQRLLMPADAPVRVHEVEFRERDAVLVTLTVFAKRVVVAAEDPDAEVSDRG